MEDFCLFRKAPEIRRLVIRPALRALPMEV